MPRTQLGCPGGPIGPDEGPTKRPEDASDPAGAHRETDDPQPVVERPEPAHPAAMNKPEPTAALPVVGSGPGRNPVESASAARESTESAHPKGGDGPESAPMPLAAARRAAGEPAD